MYSVGHYSACLFAYMDVERIIIIFTVLFSFV